MSAGRLGLSIQCSAVQGSKVDIKVLSLLSLADGRSYNSYHVSFHQDAAKTAFLMQLTKKVMHFCHCNGLAIRSELKCTSRYSHNRLIGI